MLLCVISKTRVHTNGFFSVGPTFVNNCIQLLSCDLFRDSKKVENCNLLHAKSEKSVHSFIHSFVRWSVWGLVHLPLVVYIRDFGCQVQPPPGCLLQLQQGVPVRRHRLALACLDKDPVVHCSRALEDLPQNTLRDTIRVCSKSTNSPGLIEPPWEGLAGVLH